MNQGYIKLHRKIFEWGWYSNNATRSVFIHLVIAANHKPKEYLGHKIERGQVVTGYPALAKKLGLTVQNVRTAYNHLKSTGEITVNQQPKFSIVTINNYNQYQPANSLANSQLTGNQQATNNKQEYKNEKNEKKYIERVINFYENSFNTKILKITDTRKTKIKARLKSFGIDNVLKAIENYSLSAFHCGDNEKGWGADLDWIIKNDENIEKGIKLKLKSRPPTDDEIRKSILSA